MDVTVLKIASYFLLLSSQILLFTQAAEIICQSKGDYHACPVDAGRYKIQLVQQLSEKPCIEWETWGFERDKIWVDLGCQGRFALITDSQSQGKVCFYSSPHFQGQSHCLTVNEGYEDLKQLPFSVHSIKIYGAVTLTLYQQLHYHSPQTHYRNSQAQIPSWNNYQSLKLHPRGIHATNPNQNFSELDNFFFLRSANQQCLTVPVRAFKTNHNQSEVVLSDCQTTANQQWQWRGQQLVNRGGKCLTIEEKAFETQQFGPYLHVETCLELNQQKWYYQKTATLVSHNNLCLDVHRPHFDQRKTQGRVQIWSCTQAINQQWQLIDVYLHR